MKQERSWDIETARQEISRQSVGGAPFLIAYGASFLVAALLSLWLELETAALVAIFQGAVALPIALGLERWMGRGAMSADNPLKQLSVLLAISQAAMLPALIVLCNVKPVLVPLLMASFGAMHLAPYAWLHRTRLYLVLAGLLVFGSSGLLLSLQADSFAPILALIGGLYLGFAPALWWSGVQHLKAESSGGLT